MPCKRCLGCNKKIVIRHDNFKRGRCLECFKNEGRKYNKYERNDKYNAFYQSREYKQFRNRLALTNPYCNRCLTEGKYVPSKICHHIIPIKEDYSKRLDESNIEFLCQSCHNQEHKKHEKE